MPICSYDYVPVLPVTLFFNKATGHTQKIWCPGTRLNLLLFYCRDKKLVCGFLHVAPVKVRLPW